MMGVTCSEVQTIIDSWEQEGSISPAEMCVLEEHLASCSRCARRYGALSVFIRRDGSARTACEGNGDDKSFTEKVMAEVPHTGFRRRTGVYRYITAAAAVLIAGILVLQFSLISPRPAENENGSYVEVRFTLAVPEAGSVSLVGDFTDWEASKHSLTDPDKDGVWETSVRLRKGRVYEYNFIIDGETWIPDPNALLQVDDGFGGESSVLSL